MRWALGSVIVAWAGCQHIAGWRRMNRTDIRSGRTHIVASGCPACGR
jgi:hypothetical protein